MGTLSGTRMSLECDQLGLALLLEGFCLGCGRSLIPATAVLDDSVKVAGSCPEHGRFSLCIRPDLGEGQYYLTKSDSPRNPEDLTKARFVGDPL